MWHHTDRRSFNDSCQLWGWKISENICLSSSSSNCECCTINNKFLSSSQTDNSRDSSEPHKRRLSSITIRLGWQGLEMEARSHRAVRAQENGAVNAPRSEKKRKKKRSENQKRRKQIINSNLWTMHWALYVWAANDMHRLGGGRGGVPPTQPATSHSLDNCITERERERERFTLIMKSFAC